MHPFSRLSLRTAQIGAVFLIATVGPQALAEYPDKVVRIVVGHTAGSPPDILSRIIVNELLEAEGWKVVVENRPGAIQTLAAAEVLKAPADGYAVYPVTVPVAAAPSLLPNTGFDLTNDMVPVIQVSRSYTVLITSPSIPAQSVAELVTYAKSQPQGLNFSSAGFGTPSHLIGEMFKRETGIKAVHVPYQQMPLAVSDLLNSTNHFMFIATLPVVDLVNSGKLNALAVTSPKRIEMLKGVPSVVEQGMPNLVVQDWLGFTVKAGTSADVVNRLNEAINKALKKGSVREAFAKLGAEPVGGAPGEFGNLLRSQTQHWAKVIREADIKIQR
jgi:tripartite-type tricarboxylate transporter receptor subunit TctC